MTEVIAKFYAEGTESIQLNLFAMSNCYTHDLLK